MICFVKQTKETKPEGIKSKRRKDMKKYLIAIAMVLTLGMNADAAAQKHRHTPRTEQVDSVKKDAIEAFSDTTVVADANDDEETYRSTRHVVYADEDVKGVFEQVFGGHEGEMFAGLAMVLGILFILFVLFPLIIIIGVVYFINRRRKERLKIAQMAMDKGQPIPDHLFKEEAVETTNDYQSGVRQMFTGVGLAIFLGIIMGQVGIGIGALVFFIGLGKWYIARQAGNNNHSSINNLNNQGNDKTTDAL